MKKQLVELPISEWTDLGQLTAMIDTRYGAKMVSIGKDSAKFIGKEFEVVLNKIKK
jgi:hypothetical protein